MPLLNVKLSAKPDPVTTKSVAELLTGLTNSILKKRREVTAVQVEYIPQGQWFIGGMKAVASVKPTFSLDIKVTSGTNTKDEMREYLAAVCAGMQKILGTVDEASYVVIHELRADSWGFGGLTQEHRYVHGKIT
jgi:4-oxalocrotonate tautomerase